MMRKPFIVFIFLIAFLTPACGYPWMAGNNSTAQNATQQANEVLLNTTQSDKDIALLEHLIEVDDVQFQSENKLYVRETLIFKNVGTQNFSGSLRTWVPDGAQIIKRNDRGEVTKEEMTTGNITDFLPIVQNGNILSWRDDIETNSIASIYIIEYLVTVNPEGTLVKSVVYTKMLAYPALINYQYAPSQDIPPLVLVITKPQDSSITLTDENGNKISPSDVSEQGNVVTDRFSSTQFQELNIWFTASAIAPAQIAAYGIIGLLIIIALSYPFLRKRSERLQAFEEKIRGSLKKEEVEEKKAGSETVGKAGKEKRKAGKEDTEFEGKTRDELLNLKNEMLSKVGELDTEYKSGNLLDEEYEALRKPYQEKIERITRRIEEL